MLLTERTEALDAVQRIHTGQTRHCIETTICRRTDTVLGARDVMVVMATKSAAAAAAAAAAADHCCDSTRRRCIVVS